MNLSTNVWLVELFICSVRFLFSILSFHSLTIEAYYYYNNNYYYYYYYYYYGCFGD